MISVIAHLVYVLIIYMSEPRQKRNIAQQCANERVAIENLHSAAKIVESFNVQS